MTIVYCVCIFLFLTLAVALFVLKLQKDKKRLDKFEKECKTSKILNEKDIKTEAQIEKDVVENENQVKQEAEFEEFELKENLSDKKVEKDHFMRKSDMFDFDEAEDSMAMMDDEKEDDSEDKFSEYERFLKENLGLDDEDDVEEAEDDEDESSLSEVDSLQQFHDVNQQSFDEESLNQINNFDFKALRGKSRQEIDDILATLSPKAKELLLSDILARKNWDED